MEGTRTSRRPTAHSTAPQAVAHHHRHAGEREFERDRAGFGEGRPGPLRRLARSRRWQCRLRVERFREMRRPRDDEVEVRMPPRESLRRFGEDRQHVPDLLRPRPREEAHHPPGTGRAGPRGPIPMGSCRRPSRGDAFASARRVQEGVSDELRPHAVPLEQGRLEGEHGEDAVAVSPQLSGPALPPGPHLRRDVVEDAPSLATRAAGEPQVQARVVDRQKQPHVLRRKEAPDPALQSKEVRQTPQHLRPSHDRQLIQPGDPRYSGRVHLAAADPEQARAGQPRADLPCDRRAVVIPRGLAGGDEDRRPRRHVRGQDSRPR